MANIPIDKIAGDLDGINKEVQELVTNTGNLLKNLGEINKSITKSKGLKDVNENLNKVKQAQNDIDKAGNSLLASRNKALAIQDKSLENILKQDIKAREEKKKYLAALKEEITGEKAAKEAKQQAAKAAKEKAAAEKKAATEAAKAAKEAEKQKSAYFRLSQQYKKAADSAKDLAAEYGENSEEAQKAAEKANKLNERLKAIDETVGQSQRKVGSYSDALSGIQGRLDNLTALAGNFNQSSKQMIGIVGNMAKQFAKLLLSPVVIAFVALIAAFKGLSAAVKNNTQLMKEWKVQTTAAKDAFKSLSESLTNGNLVEVWRNLRNIAGELQNITRAILEATKTQILFSVTVENAQRKLQRLTNTYDDATLSFQEREAAREKAEKNTLLLLDKQIKKSRDVIREEINRQKQILQLEGTTEEVIKAIKDKLEGEELQRFLTLQKAHVSLMNDKKDAEQDFAKKKRELQLDDFEQELDFIFDVADKRKTANEKEIADTQKSQLERQRILNETNDLLNQSFDDQINLFNTFHNLQIDTNKLLTLNNKESFEYARSLGMSERATNRLLEVIRERIAAVSDLSEAQKTLRNEDLLETEMFSKTLESQITVDYEKEVEKRIKILESAAKQAEEIEKQSVENRKALRQELVNTISESGNVLFDLGQSQRERELEGVRSNYAAQIEAAGENTKLKEKLAKELAVKEATLQRQQAQSERNQALFNVAINTAQGIAKTVSQFGMPAAIPFIALVSALGGLQTAAILSQPLPEIPGFFKGTENAPQGLAWIAERGRELLEMPSGQSMLVEKPSLVNLEKGTKVHTNRETEQLLNKAIYNEIAINKGGEIDTDKIVRAIKNKQESHFAWNERGFSNYVRNGNSITRYMNKKGRR